MTTLHDVRRVLLDSLQMALNEPRMNERIVNDLCDQLDEIARRIERGEF